MSNDNAFRELRFSPLQLVIVFLAILVLAIFVFLLGVSVGKKQTLVEAQARPAGAEKIMTAEAPNLIKPSETAPTTAPAAPPSGAKTEPDAAAGLTTKPEKAEPGAAALPETKTAVRPEPKPKAAEPKTTEAKPAEKTPGETKTEAKPATADAKLKTPPPASFNSAPYYVQIGAVETRAAADAFAKRVTGLGFSTVVLDPLAADKKPVYRVRVGPFPSKAEAADAQTALATALKKKPADFFLVKG